MKIRFQADADQRAAIVKGVKRRDPTIDFMTAHDAGLDDMAVLAIAANSGRLLVSHDVSTMPEHFGRFIEGRSSAGVILISQQLSYHDAIEGLLRTWATTEAEDWMNVLSFLPR